MRRAVACLIVAAAALVAAWAPFERAERETRPAKIRPSPGRIVLTPADRRAAAPAGFLPGDAQSILEVDRRLRYGEFVWNEREVPAGPVAVAVDLRTQVISVFRAGHEIGTAVIVYGADGHDTPLGTLPVRSKVEDYRSRAYDAPMPFTLWLTEDGVAIHASDVRRGRATHGCIGVPPAFAAKLFAAVQVGDPVTVVRSPGPAARATTT